MSVSVGVRRSVRVEARAGAGLESGYCQPQGQGHELTVRVTVEGYGLGARVTGSF